MAKTKDIISKRRLLNSYITTIISISLVLFLLGITGLLLLNSKKLSDYVKENIGFTVFLKEDVKEVDIIRLQKDLDASPYVKSTEYITREAATKELTEDLGEDFVEFLGYSPLLASIDVKFHAEYANNDSIALVENELKEYPQIKEVSYNKSLIQTVNENIRKISLILLAFSLILSLISFTLINNTIRLSVYSKRFIINSMKMVGATKNFIRWPFLLRSALHGVIGALLAIGMLFSVVYSVQQELNDIISFQDIEIILLLFGIVIVLGVAISWISTFFAVNKYLRLKSSDLYF
ncbi:MAG: permease-like cell division protein FtsX [Bacteroidota bacterium]